jgi:protein SCO1
MNDTGMTYLSGARVSLRRLAAVLIAAMFLLLQAGPAMAQLKPGNAAVAELADVGLDQKLNEQLPLDTLFKDEAGRTVKLGDFFGKKPVILTFGYYECPMLCTLVLNGLVKGLRTLSFDVGNQFEIVTISINPREGHSLAAGKKNTYVREYARPGAAQGWHFLTGEEPEIRRATQAAGFRYKFDPSTGQYSHASGIMVVTPKGKLARYLYGVEYSGQDLRLGLIEAAEEKIGSPVDQVLLFCFHYDPVTGKYGLAITRIMQILGSATAIALFGFMWVMFRRDRHYKLRTTNHE